MTTGPAEARGARGNRRSSRARGIAVASTAVALVFAAAVGPFRSGPDVRKPDRDSARAGAGLLPGSSLFAADPRDELGAGEYRFLPVRHAIWVVNVTEGRFARYEFRDERVGIVRRSRVVSIDRTVFPPPITEFLVSDRNLTEDLWVGNRRTGAVRLWEARLDGNLVPRDSEHDLGPGNYTFLPSRYTIWVVDETAGTMEYLHFRHDQDRTVIRSERVRYELVDFPPRDTYVRLSERNYAEVLWLCNRETGDVQIWQPSPRGNGIRRTGTFTTSL